MFTTWAPYALVGAGATGIWLMQSAFNAGPLPLSLPAISAGEPLVGILLGVLIFGDRIQISPGELALQAGGIVALIAGVILVGRAPALGQLRSWTPPSLPHITGSLPTLPTLPSLPGRPGRHSTDDAGLAQDPDVGDDRSAVPRDDEYGGDRDVVPRHDEYGGERHRPGPGRLNGYAPTDPARAPDSAPLTEPADPPKPLRA
jgi:hypothetical protein